MRRALIATLLFAGAAIAPGGCAEPKPVDAMSTPQADTTKEGPDSAEDPCVKACTDERRAEAMDWSAIVSECEASCAKR